MRKIIYILTFALFIAPLSAQIAFDNGAIAYASKGAIIKINGGLQVDNTVAGPGTFTNYGNITITSLGGPGNILITNNATLQGSGIYHLDQNWINDAIFNADSGTIDMNGNLQQLITSNNGTVSTFDTLVLNGTGTLMNRRKQLTLNANVAGALLIHDRVLFTAGHTLFITTPNLTAITNSTVYTKEGFVASNGAGSLSRATNVSSPYLYPVGADSVVLRYRKVLLTPASVNPNTYTVRLSNNDASNDGDSIKLLDTSLCNVNPFFYHKINHTIGIDNADIDIFYDTSTDGIWTGIAQWNTPTVNEWNNLGVVKYTSASPYSNLLKKNWGSFSNDPFILSNASPHIKLIGNDSICKGDSLALTVSGGVGYVWSNGATSSTITVAPTTSTTYTVSVSNGSCKIDSTKRIKVNPLPVAVINGINTICTGDSTVLTATGGISYIWNTGATTSNIKIDPSSSTGYSVKVSNGACTKDTNILVTVNNKPNGNISGNSSVCNGSNTTLIASGGTSYSWNTGATTSGITISPTGATNYFVIIIQNGCSDTVQRTIRVNPVPVVTSCCDSSIMLGQNVQLTSSGGAYYSWVPPSGLSCTNCPDPSASPTNTITYTLTASSDSGCSVEETITIEVTCGEVFVPNAFSPNDDGQNDRLYVRGDCIRTMDFMIFDRWGNKVFETDDKSFPWDGTFKGQPMNTGTYTYVLNATMHDGSIVEKKGNVALVR